jgi:hypothetical protein
MYSKLGDFESFTANPFIEEAVNNIERQTVRKTKMIRPDGTLTKQAQLVVSNSETGEAVGFGAFMQYVELDEEKFAKLYVSQFAAFWELSKPAIRVFGFILTLVRPGADSFVLRMDKALDFTKYAHRKMVLSGLSDLVKNGIIARSKYADEYFINPLVFFNGNRVVFAKTYIKKRTETEQANQLDLFSHQEQIENFENKMLEMGSELGHLPNSSEKDIFDQSSRKEKVIQFLN